MRVFILTLVLIVLSGCSDNKTLVESGTDFVQLASLEVSSNGVPVDSLNILAFTSGGNSVNVLLTVRATVITPLLIGNTAQSSTSPPPEFLNVSILAPDGGEIFASVLPKAEFAYEGTINFSVDQNAVGNYTVAVTASASSNVRRKLRLYRTDNAAPQLLTVVSPDTVQIPASGIFLFQITATASDANGLSDVVKVNAVRADNAAATFDLLDDGAATGLSGDATSGDGIFTATVQVPSTNSASVRTFNYRAIDRTGDSSNTISKSIVFIK